MIGRKAEEVLNRAVRHAVECEHEYFTLEHVLWSLLAERSVLETIEACGGDAARLKQEIESYLSREIPKAAKHPKSSPDSSPDAFGKTSGDSPKNLEDSDIPGAVEHPVATLSIQRLIQRALFQVQSSGKGEIYPIDLFVALFQDKESHAFFCLSRQGIERLDVLNFVSHGLSGESDDPEKDEADSGDDPSVEIESSRSKKKAGAVLEDPLKTYAINLNERASQGKIDPLVGRQLEVDRMIQTLCRRRKNNPLLVGEAGVGKTALAEGLALRIVEGQVPDLLQKAIIYALDMGTLLAGAKFRGDFEGRLKKVIQAVEKKRDRGFMPILLIDEIHTIVGAGAVSGGSMDAANLLKPVLSQGEFRVIGSTTYAEYRSTFEKDHALARRFQKIDVVEPTQEETIQILNGLKTKFEDHHQVTFTHEAIRAAVELASKHITDRFQPDKAIDVIDEAGAKARLKRGANPAPGSENPVIDATAIEEVVAQIARIPARSVNVGQKTRLKNLDRDLKLTIFGQDPAIDALVTSIRLARSGLRSGDKPVGSFLFCGPTGVGKTELSKQLAHCLGIGFHRFDMSEYSEKHTISRLIGAPPGYVGFEQAGLLTEALIKNPHSVILLDEIEKAHSDIWNILLQVMDHGTLTDSNGRKADFRNAILILTSNVGSRELERHSLGLVPQDVGGAGSQKALEQTFTPEFRNRLDAIVYFNPLDIKTVAQVVGKQIVELESQLLAKQVEIQFEPEARDWLCQKGYDKKMGARPLARLIQDKIKKTLAEEILFGSLQNGGEVFVRVKEGELSFEYKKAPDKSPERLPEKSNDKLNEKLHDKLNDKLNEKISEKAAGREIESVTGAPGSDRD